MTIDARTARCRWTGERMDYNIAIHALCREAGVSMTPPDNAWS